MVEAVVGLVWPCRAAGAQRTFVGDWPGISPKTAITFKIWVLGELGSDSREAGKSENWTLELARSLLHRRSVGVVPPRGTD
jgi:hypothetical protein